VSIDGGAFNNIPLVWGTEFDLGSLPEVAKLPAGKHAATICALSKGGVPGEPATVTFQLRPTPAALGNLSITTG